MSQKFIKINLLEGKKAKKQKKLFGVEPADDSTTKRYLNDLQPDREISKGNTLEDYRFLYKNRNLLEKYGVHVIDAGNGDLNEWVNNTEKLVGSAIIYSGNGKSPFRQNIKKFSRKAGFTTLFLANVALLALPFYAGKLVKIENMKPVPKTSCSVKYHDADLGNLKLHYIKREKASPLMEIAFNLLNLSEYEKNYFKVHLLGDGKAPPEKERVVGEIRKLMKKRNSGDIVGYVTINDDSFNLTEFNRIYREKTKNWTKYARFPAWERNFRRMKRNGKLPIRFTSRGGNNMYNFKRAVKFLYDLGGSDQRENPHFHIEGSEIESVYRRKSGLVWKKTLNSMPDYMLGVEETIIDYLRKNGLPGVYAGELKETLSFNGKSIYEGTFYNTRGGKERMQFLFSGGRLKGYKNIGERDHGISF